MRNAYNSPILSSATKQSESQHDVVKLDACMASLHSFVALHPLNVRKGDSNGYWNLRTKGRSGPCGYLSSVIMVL